MNTAQPLNSQHLPDLLTPPLDAPPRIKGTRATYRPEQRAAAVAHARQSGMTLAEASRALGIHPTTLGYWLKEDGVSMPRLVKQPVQGEAQATELEKLRRERDALRIALAAALAGS